ncbi:hypothetical protein [Paenibacillus sp. HB172176]|uniref:hypothetical protein n=1 Tax=Paenibacillus sp. HB172176 TaxID=2493690 RepID=UPI00143AE340|nr:hypothetical protein [Paenibacillus sp. HB172176]
MDFLDFSSYDSSTWSTFLKDNWFVLLIALLVLFLIIRIVKTVVKWAIVAVIVLAIVLYSGYSLDDVKQLGTKVMDSGLDDLKELGEKMKDSAQQQAYDAMLNEAKEAQYTVNEDGTYTVSSPSIELRGTAGSDEAELSVKGSPFITVKVSELIRTFVNQAKQNG